MPTRQAEAIWKGTLLEGGGELKVESGSFEGPYSHAKRFKDERGLNPEELVGAAHAGCYSMFLSSLLSNEGFPPEIVHTTASVHLERDEVGPLITLIELHTTASVPGIAEERFLELSVEAKEKCPISRALAGPEIKLEAKLR